MSTDARGIERYRGLLVVLATALAARLAFGLLTARTYDYDEFVILLLARDFARGEVPYRDFMFFHPPGALVIFRVLEPLTGIWWQAGRAVSVVADTITAGLIWVVASAIYERRLATAAGLLYAFSPVSLIAAVRVGQDPIITMLGVAGLALLVRQAGTWPAVAAGVLLSIGIWIKYPALYFAPVYLLAAPRRTPWWLLGMVCSSAALFVPFHADLQQMYAQTVTFQAHRWDMPIRVRLETTALYWGVANSIAIAALLRRRQPIWLAAGVLLGLGFLVGSQVYYHYFVLVAPFGALLGAAVIRRFAGWLVPAGATALLLWAAVIDLGGPNPLFVTAAHLSSVEPTVTLLDRVTQPRQPILADRYEYAYLANRPALAHYFWNVGVLVTARWLERRVPRAGAVVLSEGASSGYPPGFVRYLNRKYPRIHTASTTLWLPRARRASYGYRK